MKKRTKLLVIAILMGTIVPIIGVFAASTEIIYPEITSGIIAPTTTRTLLPVYVKYLFTTLVALSGIIAFGSGAYAGVRIAMSAGDPSAFSEAKEQMLAAALGIAFTLGAIVILNTVDPQIVTVRPYNEMELGIMLDTDPNCDHANELATNPAKLNELNQYIMRITKSNPDLGGFNAQCLRFISPPNSPGTLEVKIFSNTNYSGLIGTAYNNDANANATVTGIATPPKSISFVWKIAGVYLIKATNEERYLPSSTGTLGNDFSDAVTKIRFRSTTDPTNPIHFGVVLHDNDNWAGKCRVYATNGTISAGANLNWVTTLPQITPYALNTAPAIPFGVSSVTTFNPAPAGSANDGVTFCEDSNNGGRCYGPYRTRRQNVVTAGASEANTAGGFGHDIITSIKIEGNYIAVLFAEPNAEGLCEVFTKSDANLADNPIGRCYCGPFGWGCKDCLSSFIIIPTR